MVLHDGAAKASKTLWLPGQQLHGSMIPRPESVHERNQELETKLLDRLLLFEARLAALKAAEASGGGLERIRKRVSMIRHAEEPRASGFELVCTNDSLADEPVFGDLCIGSYREEPKEAAGGSSTQKLPRMCSLASISEDEGSRVSDDSSASMPHTYEAYCERVCEEEGLEVVAWGHLAPETQEEDDVDESESMSRDEDDRQAVPFEDAEGAIHMMTSCNSKDATGTLSMLYQESDSTFVAFYRS